MRTKSLKYWMVMQGPIIGIISFYGHGILAWLLPIYAFVIIPIAELFLPASTQNMSEMEEEVALADPFYDWVVYLLVPIQYGLLAFYLYIVCFTENSTWDFAGKTFSMGIACGILGINVAHELGHRIKPSERFMSKALLLTSLYMHFYVEHNRGHHKNVATPNDPATSRYGEVVYFFWIRSIINSWLSAWSLEAKRMKKEGKSTLSFSNEMIRYIFIQLGFIGLIYLVFGLKGMLSFLAVATIGFLLLETVNYIEHYGLTRKKSQGDNYERVLPVHSWNSNHFIGRLLLFELSRHSDHHYKASRKYQILRHFEDSPQMPTGYPGMIVLALVPPIWFYVMHRNIEKYSEMHPEAVKAWA
ncbi:MAG: alkane 1-monooxygenase [Bacteroidia bacterium]|nr:alkane 1-monooxygenase [Bacteroidia bacterium]